MNELDKVVLRSQFSLMQRVCYIGKPDAMEDTWDKLEKCTMEMLDESLSIEEREFSMQRALYLLNELKQYYIGVNTNENN